jgi:hypothetical protein
MHLFVLVLLAVFLAGAWGEAGALTPAGQKISSQVKGQGVQKEPGLRKNQAPTNSVRRVTKLIKKIEGGVLYTETGQYSLAGVQVLDLAKNLKTAGQEGMAQKTAEMTFVNHRLKEVVIRQRQ